MTLTNEQSIDIASTIVAIVPSPEDFPGIDALGNPPNPVAEAIINAGFARAWGVGGDYHNTRAFGELVAMLQYGVVNESEIRTALRHARNNS